MFIKSLRTKLSLSNWIIIKKRFMSINRFHFHIKLHNSINRKKNISLAPFLRCLFVLSPSGVQFSTTPQTPTLCCCITWKFLMHRKPDIWVRSGGATEKKNSFVYSHGWESYANAETTYKDGLQRAVLLSPFRPTLVLTPRLRAQLIFNGQKNRRGKI